MGSRGRRRPFQAETGGNKNFDIAARVRAHVCYGLPRITAAAAVGLAFVIDEVGLIVSAVGSLCQGGLALMPCLMHIRLLHGGAYEIRRSTLCLQGALDVMIIIFCTLEMVTGTASAVAAIAELLSA